MYSPWVDMLLHSDTLSWFRANQFLLLLLNAACLAWSSKYKSYSFLFDPNEAQTHDLPDSKEHANHYITDVGASV